MFDAEVFKQMFQSEEDWQAFFRMVYDDETERLKAGEDFLEGEKKGLKLIFRRLNDHRYEAMGEATKDFVRSADFEKQSRELVEKAFRDVSDYDRWLDRKYADRKLIHTDWNPYGEFQKPEITTGGNTVWKNADIEAIA